MKIKRFVLGRARSITYVFKYNEKYYIIDPGEKPADVITYLLEKEIIIDYILITHCHYDHIAGIDEIMDYSPNAELFVPEGEKN